MKDILIKTIGKTGIFSKIPRLGIDRFLNKHKTNKRTLDVGGGDKPYKKYFPNSVSVDIEKTEGVDFVADVHDMSMFKDEEFEVVLCTEVLEHLYNPGKAIDEMRRVLKPGGKLILTTRFIFPIHNAPGDYFRFTKYGLKHLLQGFNKVEIEEETGTIGALAVLFERIAFQADTLYLKPFSIIWLILSKVTLLFGFLLSCEYGDITRKEREKNIMSSGYYVVAIK